MFWSEFRNRSNYLFSPFCQVWFSMTTFSFEQNFGFAGFVLDLRITIVTLCEIWHMRWILGFWRNSIHINWSLFSFFKLFIWAYFSSFCAVLYLVTVINFYPTTRTIKSIHLFPSSFHYVCYYVMFALILIFTFRCHCQNLCPVYLCSHLP